MYIAIFFIFVIFLYLHWTTYLLSSWVLLRTDVQNNELILDATHATYDCELFSDSSIFIHYLFWFTYWLAVIAILITVIVVLIDAVSHIANIILFWYGSKETTVAVADVSCTNTNDIESGSEVVIKISRCKQLHMNQVGILSSAEAIKV